MIRIGDYYFDAALSEQHEIEAEITEHPVEKGLPVTDNRRRLPRRVTIEFAVSDTPIGEAYTRRAGAIALEEEGLVDKLLPSKEAREYLEKLDETGDLFSISTNLRDYDSMLMESLSIDVSSETDGGLSGTIVLKQVRIVENRRVRVRVAQPRGAKRQVKGQKQGAHIVGEAVIDSDGHRIITIDRGNGEAPELWYTYGDNSNTPKRPLTRNEQNDFFAQDVVDYKAARYDSGRGWIDSRNGQTIPEGAVPAGRYPGDSPDVENRNRIGNPFAKHFKIGGF